MSIELTRRGALGAMASTAGLVALAACGAGGSGTPSGSTQAGPPRRGGTLRVGAVGTASKQQRDPHMLLRNDSDNLIHSLVFDPLTVPAESEPVAPRLAKSWVSDPTQREWTFTIADGAVFHDGSPVRPEDVVFSLRRLHGKPGGDWKVPVEPDDIQVAGPHAVKLVSKTPNSQLPLLLRFMTFVMKEGSPGLITDSPGTGPFVLESYTDGTARLRANDQWYGGRPYVDAITVTPFADTQALANAVTSGQIDLASAVGPLAGRAVAGRKDLAVVRRRDDTNVMLAMRASDGPFADPRVRQAVAKGIDRDAMVKQVYSGWGAAANDVLGVRDPKLDHSLVRRRDVEDAKRLLAEAKFDTSKRYTLYTKDETFGEVASARLAATQLRDIGLQIDVSAQEPSVFYDKYWKTPQASLMTVSWGTNDSIVFYAGKILASTSSANETKFNDPEYDRTYADLLAHGHGQEQDAAFEKLQQIEFERGPYVSWGLADGVDVTKANVHGVPTITGYGRVQLEKVWLSS
ncbi:ABC transporter substrate-binding protein [Tsukamurella sp. 8F]|uniref:ABC transporter substrate-binding protein n=1 Tax=unclassified Tsukamurella TaxID=2633480 RepID=UPI0023B91F69|nr:MULTISPECIES: ABC transporter substrate-binding protein [unclassified Tsukamurella]MDF0531944.1 ABC transporter substrate-binding protein [Tsukamurella sp. 8J]MDF0588005.1 ABC transporter substrate-binding protein [Tsukamurella sp. 8F]